MAQLTVKKQFVVFFTLCTLYVVCLTFSMYLVLSMILGH